MAESDNKAGNDKTAYDIERLLRYGISKGMLQPLDVYEARNRLLELFGIAEPYEGELTAGDVPADAGEALAPLLDAAAAAGLMEEDTVSLRDLLDAKLMGLLLPKPSELVRQFKEQAQHEGIEGATGRFYQLCIDSNYIRMDRIANNLYWLAPTSYGELEITVNLSKPEKDPREIAKLKSAPQSGYPKCLLCVDNVGYAGRLNHPARQNLRVIPLQLGGETWYFQYSPYVYYNEHSIVLDHHHRPMKTSARTFERLLDFVEQFPHYFIGSNADLPIVGGSILNHDHFQAGRHQFAMAKAPVEREFRHNQYPGVKAGIVKWPMSVIRLQSEKREPLEKLMTDLLELWQGYNDEAQGIRAYTDGVVPHNTITPIARKNAAGEFEADLVLRNNRTTDEHPAGLFHPHRELHHIKQENIGLIEVMGLAVLPGRLKEELAQLADVLTGGLSLEADCFQDEQHPVSKHTSWIEELAARYGTQLEKEQAEQVLREETGRKFEAVLQDAGVYKRNEQGIAGFDRFMAAAGFQQV